MMNNEITKEWIAQQRAVCEAASPGPWGKTNIGVYDSDGAEVCEAWWASDIRFIAAARTSLPAALDALEAAHAEIASLRAERDAAIEDVKVAAFSDNPCVTCFYSDRSRVDFPCKRGYGWCGGHGWGYRGLCAENAPEGGNGDG